MPPRAAKTSTAIPQHSLGLDAHDFVAEIERGFGRSRAPRQATRQALYMDEEEDFVADNHPVTAARRLALQQLDLEANEEAHVDAGEELGDGEGDVTRTAMPAESEANRAQLRADLHDKAFLHGIKKRTLKGTQRTASIVERQKIATTQEHDEDKVRAIMIKKSIPTFKRLEAARALAAAERDRQFRGANVGTSNAQQQTPAAGDDDDDVDDKVPGAATSGTAATTTTSGTAATTTTAAAARSARTRPRDPRSQAVDDLLRKRAADRRAAEAAFEPPAAEAVTIAELEKMLPVGPFGEINRKLQLGLLALPDMQSVVELLNPLLYEDEFDKSHFNTLEVIESMLIAGAKWVDMQRIKMSARLALALDPKHYGAYIVRGDGGPNDVALCGGHEHFVDNETTLILMEFRCVRRNLENNRDGKSQAAHRVMVTDLGEVYEREMRPVVEERDEGDAYVYEDVDDDYQDGNNLKDVARHFIYKVTLAFVEARDVHCTNETLLKQAEPKPSDGEALDAALGAQSADRAEQDDDDDDGSDPFDIFAPPKPKVLPTADANGEQQQMDEFRYDGGRDDDDEDNSDSSSSNGENGEFLPTGKMSITPAKARILVGKWHANKLIGWLNGTQRPGPLCFRAYHISI